MYEDVRFPDRNKRMGSRPLIPSHDHKAVVDGTTIFQAKISEPDEGGPLLKGGHHNPKIGKKVRKGPWKGMPIYTLTLIERETCPTSCKVWRTCYGNNMNWSTRWRHGPDLEAFLEKEVWALERAFPKGFVIRLHILGDFYSVEYVELWKRLMRQCPGLRIFGFTAWEPSSDIGKAVAGIRGQYPERWFVRFSGAGLKTMSTEVLEMPEHASPGTVVCPEMMKQTSCCATCGLCWHGEGNIGFLRH